MILVFVGAGGSAAVDRKQYPTTVGFFKKLPERVTSDALFTKVCEFLNQHGIKEPDIEDVLEVLDELQEAFKKINNPTNIVGWAMRGRLGLIEGVSDFAIFQGSIATWERNQIAPLKDKINEQVYKFYGTRPAPNKLSAWIRLLKGLEEIDSSLEIFTTNYGLVLEDVIEEAKVKVDCGLDRSQRSTRLDPAFWNPSSPLFRTNRGLLTKLHGSVDWHRDNGDIIVGTSRFSGDHQNHCILYPGYKGVPTEEPFRAFHEHLRNVVREEYESLTAAIFIGFAFRDDYINTILSDLPPATLTCFITKPKPDEKPTDDERPPRAPSTNEYMHLLEGLTAGTVERCLASISKSVRHNRSPQNDPGS